jgi:hypothetical protein
MIYICYDKDAGVVRTCYRNPDLTLVYPNATFGASVPNVYLRLLRYGSKVSAYASADGINYQLLQKFDFTVTPAYVGLVELGTNVTTNFAKWSLTGYDPMSPVMNLLLDD